MGHGSRRLEYWVPYESTRESHPWLMDPGSSTCRLSGQLLATCQKIYWESSNVLYSENTFGLHVYIRSIHDSVEIESRFFEGLRLDELSPVWPAKSCFPRGADPYSGRITYQFAVDKIRGLRIVIDLDYGSRRIDEDEFNHLQHVLGNISHHLARTQLQYLNIDLRSPHPMTRFCILDPFIVLRGLREVTFNREPKNPANESRKKNLPYWEPERPLTRMPPKFKRHLKALLESVTPVSEDFMRDHHYQRVLTFLDMHRAPDELVASLRCLVKEPCGMICYDGPFEACEHYDADEGESIDAKQDEGEVSEESEEEVESASGESETRGTREIPQ